MKSTEAIPSFKISEQDSSPEVSYEAWKRKKIVKGLAQTKDRASMIPADQVWRELGLEG